MIFKKQSILIIFRLCLTYIAAASLISCSEKPQSAEEDLLASAYGESIDMSDIAPLLGANMTKQDSFFFIKEYVDNWLQNQVILHYARKDNAIDEASINKKAEDFKHDLIRFEYRNKLLSEQLDTLVEANEVLKYYKENPENFELKQNIIRFVFIKMPKALEDKYNYWNTFSKGDAEDRTKLAIIALKNGGNAYLDNEKWLAFDDILKVVPITTYNQEDFINNNRLFKIENSSFTWYIHISDFRIKDHVSPYEFVEDKIKQILINRRKVLLMQKIENRLVKKALKDDQIKIYMKEYE